MIWVSIIASLILLFSIMGGIKEGAVKQFFTLLATLVAIPIAGLSYQTLGGWLSFIPGDNWEYFVAFFVMMAVVSVALHFVFLLPSRFFQKAWESGVPFWVLGAVFNIVNAAIGMVVFALVLGAYPIFDWLERAVDGSVVLTWLVSRMSFVQAVLPEVFRQAATMAG